jgi:hypothetical protein
MKISPLTNHRNTKKGAIKGGFDRTILFENVEKGFDKLFEYDRQLPETFAYCNAMKNGSIAEKLQMQEEKRHERPQYRNDPVTGIRTLRRIGAHPEKHSQIL